LKNKYISDRKESLDTLHEEDKAPKVNTNLNYIDNFKSTAFFKSIVFLIIYTFMVQSSLWTITPFHSSRHFSSVSISLSINFTEKGTELDTEEGKGIFSDLIEASRNAIDLLLPSKAFAGPSCGSYIPINEEFHKSKNITPGSTSIHYNSNYNHWMMRSPINYQQDSSWPISENIFLQLPQFLNISESVTALPDYPHLWEIPTLPYLLKLPTSNNLSIYHKSTYHSSMYNESIYHGSMNFGSMIHGSMDYESMYYGSPSQQYLYNLLSNKSLLNSFPDISPYNLLSTIPQYNLLLNPSQLPYKGATSNISPNNPPISSNNPPVDPNNPPVSPNNPPVAQYTGDTIGKAGTSFSFDASISNDLDGTIVSYNWDLGDSTTSAEITLAHIFNNPGDYNVSLTVTDNDGATDTITRTISVYPNLPPRITSVPVTTATEGLLYTYKVEATDPEIEATNPDVGATDPDEDPLTYLLSLSPDGMTIDSASGLIQWTPTRDQTREQNVCIIIKDGQGNTATQQYTIRVIQTTTIVPNLISMTQMDAETAITSAILEIGIIHAAYSDTIPEGLIISQDPISETILPLNTSVHIHLSLGKADIDLELASMDTTNITVDSQTLEVTGSIDVVILNNGTSHVIESYSLTLFEDINTNNILDPGTDNVLGTLTITGYPLPRDQITVTVNVSGSILFKGNLIYALIDSTNQIKETDKQNNITHSLADCESRPPTGSFNPVLEWEWTQSPINPLSDQVMCAPVVANLNDDNGDGEINKDDIPDIIFNTFETNQYNQNGTLRAISGDGSGELFSVTDYETVPGCNPSVGDIDNDGLVEIIVFGSSPLRILAFENDGSYKWGTDSNTPIYDAATSTINIVDIDHNGDPEIIIQNIVLNNEGTTKWIGSQGRTGNAVPADINLDGQTEIIVGNTLYTSDGEVIWHNESIDRAFVAVANFDYDPYPEIVLVSQGNVYLLEHTGNITWGPIDLPPSRRSKDHGGPPTIADFDNDGKPEIGIAGGYKYVVFESNGTLKWTSPTEDLSSNKTGSSVFDFEGDGSAEVVYSDERYLRIYRGTDGTILFQTYIGSGTLMELPIIVDVDNDNNAEIVVASNTYSTGGTTGIQVFGDLNDNWVNTRKIWNQHSYHITNVNDDGTIPQYEDNNWETYNNFRQNQMLQPFACMDLTSSYIRVNQNNCPHVEIIVRIGNGGVLHTAPGLNVAFYYGDPDNGGALIGTATVDVRLNPGEYADISINTNLLDEISAINPTPLHNLHTLCVVADDDGTGFGTAREIDETNNKTSATFDLCNTNPSITSIPITEANEDIPYTYLVEATDPDQDPLTFTLTESPSGMIIDITTGLIQWTPLQTHVGENEVTIQVHDGRGGIHTQSFTITVQNTNDPPQITSSPIPKATENKPYEYHVQATDEDGDSLTYTLITSPTGMTIDSATGLIRWTPDETQIGSHTIEILANDLQGGSPTQSYTLTVLKANSPPQITSTPVTTATQDQKYTYEVAAYDLDSDPIAFILDNSPDGMTIDRNTGLIQWTPNNTQVGDHRVIIIVSDNMGATDTQSYTIKVQRINHPPEITSSITTSNIIIAWIDVPYTYTIEAIDTDSDTLTYTLPLAPEGMTIEPETGLIEWTPTESDLGDHNVSVAVTDTSGASDTQGFTITVKKQEEDTTPPRIMDIIIDPLILNPGQTTTITINAVDNKEIGSYELKVDDVDIPLIGNTATYTTHDPGVHELEATVTDTFGNSHAMTARFGVRNTSDVTPPEVSIKGPAPNSEITEPTDFIGTITEENLVYYALEYSEKDRNHFIPFHKGHSEIINDTLGTFDPTMLVNGLYDIRLIAMDVNGVTNSIMCTARVTGDLKVGNFTVTFKDLEIPVAGIPITIYRSYDSRFSHKKGDFGYGWNIDIQTTKIEENRRSGERWYIDSTGVLIPTYYLLPDGEHYVSITLPNGKLLEFDCKFLPESQLASPMKWIESTIYTPRPGTQSTLIALDDSPMQFNGTHVINYNLEIFDPDRYQLTTQDGTIYIIDQNRGILKVTDNNGNYLDFTDDGIIHSSGKSVTFIRDTEGRITEITDPMGNTLTYTYDENGDLTAFTDQEGNTSQYTYNKSHGLVDIIDPRGISPMRNEYDYDGRLIAHTDAEGNRIQYTHNIDTRQEIVKDRLGHITLYEYDNKGNVIGKIDPLGNVTTYTYDERGNKLSETDPLGNTTTYTYDTKDNMLTQTDPLGNTTSYTYNARKQITNKIDANGNIYTKEYDFKGNLIKEKGPLGNVTQYEYDTQGNKTREIDAVGNETNYTYDSYGNMLYETDTLGNTITYAYDFNGNKIKETRQVTLSTGVENHVTSYEYNGKNQVFRTIYPDSSETRVSYNVIDKKEFDIDSLGRETQYIYDPRGRVTQKIYPDNSNEEWIYDAEDNLLSHRNRNSVQTQYLYDKNGHPTHTIFQDGSMIINAYDKTGRVISIKDQRGNTSYQEYDAAGRLVKVIDPLGNETFYSYDGNGNEISMTDALGQTTLYEYDDMDRKIKTIFPDGTFSLIVYDALGRKISNIDQAGLQTRFEYGICNCQKQITKAIDALGQETGYTYNELGKPLSQTDANGNTTRFEYDIMGRMIKKILPMGQEETYAYDAAGNLISKTNFNGNTITYIYDKNNRLITKTYQDGSSIHFTYTPTGKKSSVIDLRGITTFFYDFRNNLLQRIDPDGTAISYTYDEVGNITSVIIPSGTTTYTYDALNRLSTVTDPDGGITIYTYNAIGNRSGIIYPNGTKAIYSYDSLNRLIRIENKKSDDSIISSYSYTLGHCGNRIRVEENTTRSVDYTYDALYRLTEEKINEPIHGTCTISYSYDPAGNRLTKNDSSEGITNYTYDENNRLLTENDITYTYDDNGNLINKIKGSGSVNYYYDSENRLIEVQTSSSLVKYIYDYDGIRVSSIINGNKTNYLIDKNRDYAQVSEVTNPSAGLIADYIYGDDLISMKRSGDKFFYHYDGNGNTRQLTNSTEDLTDTYTYDAFGIILDRTGLTLNNYLFAGEQYDANIGFYYLRARYLNHQTGRFITQDEFPGNPFEPITLHKYLYANANPVNMIDPSGRMSLATTFMTIGILSTFISTRYALISHIISIKTSPVKWHGWLYVMTAGEVYGAGGIIAVAESECILGKKAKGIYLMLMAGFTYGALPIGQAVQEFDIITPGIFGPAPWALIGPFAWMSVAAVYGGGLSYTTFFMGMGVGKLSLLPWAYGVDFGIDLMGGVSIPIYMTRKECL
jgi:RHS repeat-associated protein